MINKSNYLIDYFPVQRAGGFHISFRISKEFAEFAKQQKLNHEHYEEIGLSAIRNSGWRDYQPLYKICNWVCENGNPTGLLHHVRVPGNAAGVGLEEDFDRLAYCSYNMDGPSQVSAVLAVMSFYFKNIESMIP
ncbi:MAG: hypothetical protein Q8P15_02035 [Nanoarchaeota archaeon]|nr:hypothetical protein [Nanoarchaeota archaeon]